MQQVKKKKSRVKFHCPDFSLVAILEVRSDTGREHKQIPFLHLIAIDALMINH